MDFLTMGTIASGLFSAGSSFMSFLGGNSAAEAAKKQANVNYTMAIKNADYNFVQNMWNTKFQSDYVRDQGEYDAGLIGLQAAYYSNRESMMGQLNYQLAMGGAASAFSAISDAIDIQTSAQAAYYRAAAGQAKAKGDLDATLYRRQVYAQVLGPQRLGNTGVVGNEGSPMDVRESTANELGIDIDVILYNAAVQAWQYDTQAKFAEINGMADKISARLQYNQIANSALSDLFGAQNRAMDYTFEGAIGSMKTRQDAQRQSLAIMYQGTLDSFSLLDQGYQSANQARNQADGTIAGMQSQATNSLISGIGGILSAGANLLPFGGQAANPGTFSTSSILSRPLYS